MGTWLLGIALLPCAVIGDRDGDSEQFELSGRRTRTGELVFELREQDCVEVQATAKKKKTDNTIRRERTSAAKGKRSQTTHRRKRNSRLAAMQPIQPKTQAQGRKKAAVKQPKAAKQPRRAVVPARRARVLEIETNDPCARQADASNPTYDCVMHRARRTWGDRERMMDMLSGIPVTEEVAKAKGIEAMPYVTSLDAYYATRGRPEEASARGETANQSD